MGDFIFNVLAATHSPQAKSKLELLNRNDNINLVVTDDKIDFLEYLMDHKVNGLIINSDISTNEAFDLLEKISQDYDNKSTPVVLISKHDECHIFFELSSVCNVIATFNCENWDTQLNNLLQFLQHHTSVTNELKNELQESEVRNIKDPLTGALNRYGAQDRFHDLTSRYKAYQESFCLIMLDIDHFKNVNDTYGHDVGDEVLIELTHLVKSSIRSNDSLIRLGGEEFLIFLSNVSLKIASEIAEKIRIALEFSPITTKQLDITSSFGVVEYKENEELDSLLKRVDVLLYKAKTSGRNKVITEKI